MSAPLVELRGVTRAYHGPPPVVALTGASVAIHPGEILVIEGPSGGGKSTLLNILGLLDQPSAGDVLVRGTSLEGASDLALSRARSDLYGFVFQSFHLLDRREVFDSVELSLMYRGVPQDERRPLAARALAEVGLEGFGLRRANELSGGQRQRVAIARALASGAPLIIADEPTGNLDSESAQQVIGSLQQANARGVAVVLVTHAPDVAEIGQRRVRIRDGVLSTTNGTASGAAPVDDRTAGRTGSRAHRTGAPSRVSFRDVVSDAARSLASRLSRTVPLVAAVGLGVGLSIATIGVSDSARSQVASTFDSALNRDVTVTWTDPTLGGRPAAYVAGIEDRLRGLSGVEHVALLSTLEDVPMWADDTGTPVSPPVFGTEGDLAAAARLDIHWRPGSPGLLAADEVLVGRLLADDVGIGPLALAPTLQVGRRTLTVAGIVEESPRAPKLLGGLIVADAGAAPASQVEALVSTSAGAAPQVASQVALAVDYYLPELLDVHAPPDPRSLRAAIEANVQMTLWIVSAIALLGAVAGVANAMTSAVGERRGEIGLRRAIGARRRHITGLVLTEAVIVGVMGGLAGLAAGLLAVLAVTVSQGWMPVFDLRLAPLALAGGVIVGALGGAAAARRASRIEPAAALRQ